MDVRLVHVLSRCVRLLAVDLELNSEELELGATIPSVNV